MFFLLSLNENFVRKAQNAYRNKSFEFFEESTEKSDIDSQSKNKSNKSKTSPLVTIFSTILFIIAMYLWIKRGFSIGGFFAACCCTPCYIAYALAVPISEA